VLAAAGISVLTVMTQERGGGIRHLYGEGVYAHVLTVVSIHLKYLQLIFFPVGLSAVYDLPIQTTVLSLRILAAVITFGILITIFLRLYLNKSRVCFWILFYFIALLPVSHIIPIVTQMNDRYLYYPMVAVSGMIAHALSYFWRDGKGRWQKAVGVVPAVVFLLIGVLAFSTYERNRVWENGLTLWTDAMAKDPDFANPHAALGEIYMHKKVLDQSERELLKSIELDPKQLMPYVNLSAVYYQMKRWEDAALYAEKGFAIEPNNAQVRSNLGAAYKELGRFEEALSHLKRALEMDPDNDGISYNLALVYYETSRFAEAARILEGILRKTPYKLAVLVLLSVNYEKLGKDWKTEEVYLSAIKAKPDHHLLSYNLACFYATHGKPEKAIFYLMEALRKGMHDPDLLMKDPDMNSLRERSDFKEILTRMTTPPPRPF